MYPTGELSRLSSHKARLHRRLAFHRNRLMEDASRVIRPFVFLKPILVVWQAASPLAILALGMFVRRTLFPRLHKLRSMLLWSSFLGGLLRLVLAWVKGHSDTSNSYPAERD